MYTFFVSGEVNPPGAVPIVSRKQLWSGLVMKAENAIPFVPGMESCIMLESNESSLVREVVFR